MAPRRIVALMVVALFCGCIDQSRVNQSCAWSDDRSGPLDLARRSDREHLRVDVEIANELMVRWGDVHGRNRPDVQRPFRTECMRSLRDTIVARHAVTEQQIAMAERDRVWWADVVAVFMPMALLGIAATAYATRRVCRSFEPDDRIIAAAMTLVLSLLVGILTVAVTNFWAFSVEGWRLRNEHVSNRAFLIPITTHPWVCATSAITICLLTAVVQLKRTPLSGGSGAAYARLCGRRAAAASP